MWSLPSDPFLEKALVEIEADFRDAMAGNQARNWASMRAAIDTAILRSFESFSKQALAIVRRGALTISDAWSFAESFLNVRAVTIHRWLVGCD